MKTTINIATLPVAIVKDVFTLGGVCTKGDFKPYVTEKLEQIKKEASE